MKRFAVISMRSAHLPRRSFATIVEARDSAAAAHTFKRRNPEFFVAAVVDEDANICFAGVKYENERERGPR